MMVLSADNTDNSVGIRPGTAKASFPAALAIAAEAVDAALELLLPKPAGLHARVQEAMRYAVFAGGKRLRPFLVMQSAALFGVELRQAVRAAAAIESVHTYSLVHDDLPCMDDDDLRRGRPTAHKAFDEATAVLAGDALLTAAFEILADAGTHNSPLVRCRLVRELARAAGSNGMIGGQMIDMQAAVSHLGADDVITLQQMKTGALFEFCCVAGSMLGQGSVADEERLRSYARDVGLLFQITDDLLDVLGSTEKTGKAVGKDNGQGKKTLVSLWGVDVARRKARGLAEHAAETMAYYGPAADALKGLPAYLVDRES
jgi:farnesyl diphosphate synthase